MANKADNLLWEATKHLVDSIPDWELRTKMDLAKEDTRLREGEPWLLLRRQ